MYQVKPDTVVLELSQSWQDRVRATATTDLQQYNLNKAFENLKKREFLIAYMYYCNFLASVSEEEKTPEIVHAYE